MITRNRLLGHVFIPGSTCFAVAPGDPGAGGPTPSADPSAADPKPADELTADDPRVKKLIESAVNASAAGLKENSDALLDEKKALQKQLEAYGGRSAEDINKMYEAMDSTEETRLMGEGKWDEVVNRRTERMKADHVSQIDAVNEKLAASEAKNADYVTQISNIRVDDHLKRAMIDAGVRADALEDGLNRGRKIFKALEDGTLEARLADGTLMRSKEDSTKPMEPAEWAEVELRRAAGFMFEANPGNTPPGSAEIPAAGVLTMDQAGQLSQDEYEKHRREGRIV